MGKKNKPIDDGFNTLNNIGVDVQASVENIEDNQDLNSHLGISNTLEKYKQLQEQNLSLIKERDDLIQKLGYYIAEVNEFKQSKTQKSEHSNLSALTDLSVKVQELSNLNLQYINKISQLTFENASLKNQLNEFNNNSGSQKPLKPIEICQVQTDEKPPRRHIVCNNPFNNGYSSWN